MITGKTMNKESRIYVAGHKGMVGSAIIRKLGEKNYRNIVYQSHKNLDLTRQKNVKYFFDQEHPEYELVHSDVDILYECNLGYKLSTGINVNFHRTTH